jgi:hypothetical protein
MSWNILSPCKAACADVFGKKISSKLPLRSLNFKTKKGQGDVEEKETAYQSSFTRIPSLINGLGKQECFCQDARAT